MTFEIAPAKLTIRQVQLSLTGCGHQFGITAAVGNQLN